MTEAGYPNGFEVTLDCPNNRYVNDEQICLAVAAMLTQIGIQTKVTAQPRATYFPKLEKYDTSLYMLGWGGAITDAQTTLSPVLHSHDAKTGNGSFNYGRYSNPKLDALIDAAAVEMNAEKRKTIDPAGDQGTQCPAAPRAAAPSDDSRGQCAATSTSCIGRQRPEHGNRSGSAATSEPAPSSPRELRLESLICVDRALTQSAPRATIQGNTGRTGDAHHTARAAGCR